MIGQKLTFKGTEAILNGRNQVYWLILVNFHAPGSESGSAFLILIWIQIQESQINADLDRDPDPQHCLLDIV